LFWVCQFRIIVGCVAYISLIEHLIAFFKRLGGPCLPCCFWFQGMIGIPACAICVCRLVMCIENIIEAGLYLVELFFSIRDIIQTLAVVLLVHRYIVLLVTTSNIFSTLYQ